jgi:hypothetical protein
LSYDNHNVHIIEFLLLKYYHYLISIFFIKIDNAYGNFKNYYHCRRTHKFRYLYIDHDVDKMLSAL